MDSDKEHLHRLQRQQASAEAGSWCQRATACGPQTLDQHGHERECDGPPCGRRPQAISSSRVSTAKRTVAQERRRKQLKDDYTLKLRHSEADIASSPLPLGRRIYLREELGNMPSLFNKCMYNLIVQVRMVVLRCLLTAANVYPYVLKSTRKNRIRLDPTVVFRQA